MTAVTTGIRPRIDAALAMSARAHRAQVRKGTDVPYIVHPVGVAWILERHGFDEDLIVAALLHDTVEDTGMELAEIRAAFGAEVAALVDALTEKKLENGEKRPWRIRKAESLAHLARADGRVAALKAADLLHNLRSTLGELATCGPSVWQRFNAPATDWIAYHREMAARIVAMLGDHPLARELTAAVDELVAVSA
jgi:(p)ppGpp synthase/HD superfamily hydrolase